jgi:hypothetical protein
MVRKVVRAAILYAISLCEYGFYILECALMRLSGWVCAGINIHYPYSGNGLERHGAEGRRGRPVDHKLEVDTVIGELQEICVGKSLVEFADEVRRILCADTE